MFTFLLALSFILFEGKIPRKRLTSSKTSLTEIPAGYYGVMLMYRTQDGFVRSNDDGLLAEWLKGKGFNSWWFVDDDLTDIVKGERHLERAQEILNEFISFRSGDIVTTEYFIIEDGRVATRSQSSKTDETDVTSETREFSKTDETVSCAVHMLLNLEAKYPGTVRRPSDLEILLQDEDCKFMSVPRVNLLICHHVFDKKKVRTHDFGQIHPSLLSEGVFLARANQHWYDNFVLWPFLPL